MYATSLDHCNDYPLNTLACIEKTLTIKFIICHQRSKCIETQSNDLGCIENLNKQACLNQVSYKNLEQQCIFNNRCTQVNAFHLQNLGCSELFSKYACTNVQNNDCNWTDKCQSYLSSDHFGDSCESVYGAPVTPSLCQKIVDQSCMNGGYQHDYQCIAIRKEQLSNLHCSDLGINEMGCTFIKTKGQACIFKNNQCFNVLPHEPDNCELKLNRLEINNRNLNCQWIKGNCINFIDNNQKCEQIAEVNQSVCINSGNQCLYNLNEYRCLSTTQPQISKLKCNTPGVSQTLCLQIKEYNCTYYSGKCQELLENDLSFYQCNLLLNEQACINIKPPFQFCQWDGKECINVYNILFYTKMYINQDIDCPIQSNNNNNKFNGNVCQAISKHNIKCKYDQQTHKCIQSNINDKCNTPYLNLFGCVSLPKKGQACQWTDIGCLKELNVLGQLLTIILLTSTHQLQ